MSAIPVTDAEKGAVRVDPDRGRSFWVLGMLIRFKAIGGETGGDYSLFEATVPAGVGAPPHIHLREAEAFYVLDGEFEFITGDGAVRGQAGDFVRVPRGVAHGFTNVGSQPARFLAILTPGGLHEQLFAGLGEPAKAQTLPPPPTSPPDVQRLLEVARKCGTEFVLSR